MPAHLTCTKAQKRGSLRCLALSCSKANDWWLQKREEIFWNHLPSAPSNYSEIQAREGSQVGAGKAEPHRGWKLRWEDRAGGPEPWLPGPWLGEGTGAWAGHPYPGQKHISNLLNEVATVLPPFHQAIEEQGCRGW